MTECVIAMPVLLLLFLACWYFQRAYAAKIEALSLGREQAFTVRDRPDECYADGTRSLAGLSSLLDAWSDAAGATSLPSTGADQGGGYGSTIGLFRYARATREVSRAASVPGILGDADGAIEVRARVVTTCNEPAPPNLYELMESVFWDWVGF